MQRNVPLIFLSQPLCLRPYGCPVQEKALVRDTMRPLLLWQSCLWAAMLSSYFSRKRGDLANWVNRLALSLVMLALIPEGARRNRRSKPSQRQVAGQPYGQKVRCLSVGCFKCCSMQTTEVQSIACEPISKRKRRIVTSYTVPKGYSKTIARMA
jgi:hypothetical protein